MTNNKVNECRLAAALVEISALQADVDRLSGENIDLDIENIVAFGYAYGAGYADASGKLSTNDDFKGARKRYLAKRLSNGAGT